MRLDVILATLFQDCRYASRHLARQPRFVGLVVLTLGAGIGINATMFRVVDRLLFRPPAYMRDADHSGRVYVVRRDEAGHRFVEDRASYARFADLRDGTRSFDQVAATFTTPEVFGSGISAHELPVSYVSASFWRLFNSRPTLGRVFTAKEDTESASEPVVVISYEMWRGLLGSDPNVLGRELRIGAAGFTVIGVAAPNFKGAEIRPVSAWLPITFEAQTIAGAGYHTNYDAVWLQILAHRREGVQIGPADADLTAALRASATNDRTVRAPPRFLAARLQSIIQDRGPMPSATAKASVLLGGMSAIVLLLACMNVAGLLLARALRNERGAAIRLALGISRGRLLGQILIEVGLLTALGALVALAAVSVAGVALRPLQPDLAWGWFDIDFRSVAYIVVAVLPISVFIGSLLARGTPEGTFATPLRLGSNPTALHRSPKFKALLIAQAALSTVLLVGAGLFIRSLDRARTVPLGFHAAHVAVVTVDAREADVGMNDLDLYGRISDRLSELPFIDHTGTTFTLPFEGQIMYATAVPDALLDSATMFVVDAVGGDYFRAMGTVIERGRALDRHDRDGARLAVVVSASTARTLWPGKDPLGKCVEVGGNGMPCSTVVGVAQDIHATELGTVPPLQYYVAAEQARVHDVRAVVAELRGTAEGHAQAIRAALARTVPLGAYINVRSLQSIIEPQSISWRLGATLFTIFGGIALAIAMVGVYAFGAFAVNQRKRELGVRIAVGAQRRNIIALVTLDGVRPAVIGVALGLGATITGGRWIAPILFKTSPLDGPVLLAAAAILIAAAFAATIVPAWRAGKVDPTEVLREG
ncbi:MAG: ABC transporter permease [Gemmatimonadaceae bacterium]